MTNDPSGDAPDPTEPVDTESNAESGGPLAPDFAADGSLRSPADRRVGAPNPEKSTGAVNEAAPEDTEQLPQEDDEVASDGDEKASSDGALTPVLATDEHESDGFAQLMSLLDKVPFVAGMKRDLTRLQRLIGRRRPLRVACIGDGAPLLRALLGVELASAVGSWHSLAKEGRRIDWRQVETATDASSADVVLWAVSDASPTDERAALFVQAATHAFAELPNDKKPKIKARVAVVSVAPDTSQRPEVVDATGVPARIGPWLERWLRADADARALSLSEVPVVTLDDGGRALAELLGRLAPEEAAIETARALDAPIAKSVVADELIQACSTLGITLALAPVPMSDIALLAPLQTSMVSSLAYIGGRRLDGRAAAEWLASLGVVGGAAIGFRTVARQLVKLVPGAGSVVAGGIAGAGTLALGRSAKRYFIA